MELVITGPFGSISLAIAECEILPISLIRGECLTSLSSMAEGVVGSYRKAYEHPPWDIKLLYKSAEISGSRAYRTVYPIGGLELSKNDEAERT